MVEAPKKRERSAFTPPRTVTLRDRNGAPIVRPGSQRRRDPRGASAERPGDAHAEPALSDPARQTDATEGARARMGEQATGERLQKVLARAGFGSRRACEALIDAGRVAVDGEIVTEQGMRVDPELQAVHVDGRRVLTRPDLLTIALNKPRGVVSAMSDPQGRRDLTEFTSEYPQRLVHVGRLDYETEGLLLLSNDGDLTHRLTHPSFKVPKTYVCRFDAPGGVPRSLLRSLRDGVELDDGPARADRARLITEHDGEAIVEVTLHEGRNRIVRRMFAAHGHELTRLVRTRIGPVLLGDLAPGHVRELTARELGTLMAQVGM